VLRSAKHRDLAAGRLAFALVSALPPAFLTRKVRLKYEAGGGDEGAQNAKMTHRRKRTVFVRLCLKSCLSAFVRAALVLRGSVVRLPRRG